MPSESYVIKCENCGKMYDILKGIDCPYCPNFESQRTMIVLVGER